MNGSFIGILCDDSLNIIQMKHSLGQGKSHTSLPPQWHTLHALADTSNATSTNNS